MEEIFPFCSCRSLRQVPPIAPPLLSRTPPLDRCRRLRACAHLSKNTPIPLPEKPPRISPPFPVLRLSSNPSPAAVFHDKLLFLDSVGIDLFAASSSSHPALAAASLYDLRSSVHFLRSLGLSAPELRRACGMCPEILTASPSNLAAVVSFLLREAGVQDQDLRRVIFRRPRLLVSDVAGHLRPALYFLQMLGIAPIARHTSLLSCSVEEKFLPRLEFLEGVGFSPRNARAMARRFPQLFCYSIDENLRPKVEFLVLEMQRELRELRDFPQFFSFSLPNRIKPRHRTCKEKGVVFPLPVLLRPSNGQFMAQLEVRISSSLPLKRSPLWRTSMDGGL
ncbi:transcription termination factor MTEF1, chloroplastic-like [Zingiber officinale]|uniref:Transcription termination factor MTEF1, chloroplastic n=1 Tax=Zingiber officinale TaxID=94328 RepID=A0A8J5KKX1_ZINOF|nr:transcription termination factor MTEF1, chloroplastic-like [Zingiber officinale]KAG6483589.1 hypothetical protein ZIOFF_060237 [Zingiber officinale]